ncbi:MAG TPA: ChbG/HpnK family deacetylase [Hyphomicrobiaceae bacterium]|jgi:predicted glycoside hydrolase/deacetylase ChbG (UPF0249 family)|nr:ChbG/HpnK family deacetylase [Hyphomicrobiaceae bacterium]
MIILCADDYALTEGVSRAIGELAAARRLSATSALVTTAHWPATVPRLRAHRRHLAIGLHLNLTLGAPLGTMRRLAPSGQFPPRSALMAWSLLGLLSRREIAEEINRQLDRFEQGFGHPPDHIDGHEHVHVLPGIRTALLDAVARRYASAKPLVRDPSDRFGAIAARGVAPAKAALVSLLASGFAAAARQRDIPVNDGFSGFSSFSTSVPYAQELAKAFNSPAPRHIIMCHPGHPDAELAAIDAVVARRRMEYDALMHDVSLPERIWRPARETDTAPLQWPQTGTGINGR